jgi:hypothetical protein
VRGVPIAPMATLSHTPLLRFRQRRHGVARNMGVAYPPSPNRPYNGGHDEARTRAIPDARRSRGGDGALAAAKLQSEAGWAASIYACEARRAARESVKQGDPLPPRKFEQLCCRLVRRSLVQPVTTTRNRGEAGTELGPQPAAGDSPSRCAARQLSCEPVSRSCGPQAAGPGVYPAHARRPGLCRSGPGAGKAQKSALLHHLYRERCRPAGQSRVPHQA